ncbi:hypothetical protein D3C78_743140 [compost metagenome]
MLAPWQRQTDFRSAYWLLDGKPGQALNEGLTLGCRHPLAQVHAGQLRGRALQVVGQRLVAKHQVQFRCIATDHGGRIFYQHPVALFTDLHSFGRFAGLGDVQPDTHYFHRQPEVITQQPRLVEHPVIPPVAITQTITAARLPFAQQGARASQP